MVIADLHIHSKYSRATSRECVPEYLDLWARRKGIDLLGTGDFTHPAWRDELRSKLEPAEEGLYRLKKEYRLKEAAVWEGSPRFVVSGEISSIYKKNGRVRKIHNLILLPGLEEAESLARRLELIGNLHSDGRPILGLDSRDLLEITLEVCPSAVFIPAHIWTPHFSLFGAFSGFDTLEECYEDLSPHIHALETGLSSDPPMNWRISALDGYTLVSNSDAHSPSKLGREANLLEIAPSYPALAQALNGGTDRGFRGTIEFFPEEGKYHFDGHRACKMCLKPLDAEQVLGVCPACGKKMTVGVLHRVEQLADREEGFRLPQAPPFESLAPLPEVIAASTGLTAASTKVTLCYEAMLRELGNEFSILRAAPLEDVARVAGPCVSEGIRRIRQGKVTLLPGYDGEYGIIQLLSPAEISALSGQLSLFGAAVPPQTRKKPASASGKALKKETPKIPVKKEENPAELLDRLNEEQRTAVTTEAPVIAVVAGPGTGKTQTLTARVVHLVERLGVRPGEITAVTFTNRAAGEMRQRLEKHFGGKRKTNAMHIGTFHALCLRLLEESRQEAITVIDENEAASLAGEVARSLGLKTSGKALLRKISAQKNGLPLEKSGPDSEAFARYQSLLTQYGVLDYDDLLLQALSLFEEENTPAPLRKWFRCLLVDEFQDINELQYRLVRAWSRTSDNLFVIGDPDQAIYGFRGASADCFARLAEEYPTAKTVRLTKNYRSTPQILECALPVISHNPGTPRYLETQREPGEKVALLRAADEFSEALYVVKEINRMVGGIDMLDTETLAAGKNNGRAGSFSDIAVLYRTHRQAELLEKCLKIEGIPYTVAGRDSVLADDGVRGVICFFRYLQNPRDRVALRTCLKNLVGCPESLLPHLCANDDQVSGKQWETTQLSGQAPAVKKWAELCAAFAPRRKERPQPLLEAFIKDCGLELSLPLERLINMAALHKEMATFLDMISFGAEGDVARSGNKRYQPDAVSLMTLHGAKGLEFPVVFLCGLRKKVLPLELAANKTDTEEERRLFYVGMTRAKEQLTLLTSAEPSPLIMELPQEQLRSGVAEERKKQAFAGKQLSFF